MENASNALLMAAGILISIMLISLGTYLFATFGNYSKNINNNLSQTQIDEFNSQFTKYETDSEQLNLCTAHDIVTIINLAKDSNNKYEEYQNGRIGFTDWKNENNAYIYVTGLDSINETSSNTILNQFIEQNIDKNGNLTKFTCIVKISDKTGLVKEINFKIIK